jgi:hypothetical protein
MLGYLSIFFDVYVILKSLFQYIDAVTISVFLLIAIAFSFIFLTYLGGVPRKKTLAIHLIAMKIAIYFRTAK